MLTRFREWRRHRQAMKTLEKLTKLFSDSWYRS